MLANILVGTVTVLYAGAALAYTFQRDWGSALMFGSYCLANVGYFIVKGVI